MLVVVIAPVNQPLEEFGKEHVSEGRMIWLATLVELKFINLSCSNSILSIPAVRYVPPVDIRQTVPCRAIRGNSISVTSTLPPLNVYRNMYSMLCYMVSWYCTDCHSMSYCGLLCYVLLCYIMASYSETSLVIVF